MDYYHTDAPDMVEWLAAVFAQAAEHGRKVRIRTGIDNTLQLKIGEGAWTTPFESTPDPHRDSGNTLLTIIS